jgi:hypothetical protein
MNGDTKLPVDPVVAAFDLAGNVRRGRREFMKGLTAVAGATGLFGYDIRLAVAEPPPETTRIRIVLDPSVCLAPQYLAEDLLRLEGQVLRARKVGHVIVNTSLDKPWSEHFCCMLAGHRDFVRKHPVATKRALRAILKATDICARDPERAARYMVQKDYERNYNIALEVVKEVSYNGWRTFDPDNTLRFYALRLHEVGMIKSTPQKLIAQGTDWRYLNELKRELKA